MCSLLKIPLAAARVGGDLGRAAGDNHFRYRPPGGWPGIFLGALLALPAFGATTNAPAAGNTRDEIRQLQAQLAEQTRRLDRIYEALGPELAEKEARVAGYKKLLAEDAALALPEVFRSAAERFNSKLLFLPGTHYLAVARSGGEVKLLRLPAGDVVSTLGGAAGAECLAAPAAGNKVFAGTRSGLIFAWPENQTNAQKIFDWGGWPVTALAVSPDGARLVCACNGKYDTNRAWIKPDPSLLAIEVATGRVIWTGPSGRGDFQAVSFAGDGKTVAVVREGLVAVLDAGTGQTLRELAHPEYPAGPLSTALSRDGKLCAVGYAPNDVGLWDVATGKCLRLLGAHKSWVVALAFSPDGSRLASSSGDTTVSLWQVATGREIGRLRFGDGSAYVNSVAISDDGRWLAAGRSGEVVVLEMPR